MLQAQPAVTGAYYITEDQQTIEVVFDEPLTWTTAGTWQIKIGGASQPISGPSGKGTNTLKFLKLNGPIEYADVVAGVTVEYAGNGDITGITSGLPLAAFGPYTAINNVIVDCSMFTGVQGISVDALSGTCSPVSVTLSFFWEFTRQARNSIYFREDLNNSRVHWNDPANTRVYTGLTETSPGSRIFESSASFTYPTDGTECVYTPEVYPCVYKYGTGLLWCYGGSSLMTQALTNWNTDDRATGQLQITPNPEEVCLGQDFEVIFQDVTDFNCDRTDEPNKPNIGPRYVQFVYGTGSGRQIPNVFVNGVQVTDNDGNLMPGMPYEDPTVHYYDSANNPFPNAESLPVIHAGDYTNDQIGDVFEITMRNWNPCNPYFGGLGTPREAVAQIVIVDGPIADAGPDQTICEGSTAVMDGSISHTATSATWTTAGDGTFGNPSSLDAEYDPGPNDISNGSVWLYLTTNSTPDCDPFTDSLLLTIEPEATIATTGPDDIVCGTTYPNLGGNAPDYGAGEWAQWTVVSGSGVFDNDADPTTGVSGLSAGPNVFRWTIYRGTVPCTSSDEITITRDVQPNPANAGLDQVLCDTDVATLDANTATNGGTGTWSVVSNPIWYEQFTGLADGTTSDGGATAWSRTISSTGGGWYSEVRSEHYEMTRNRTVWTSGNIDISSATNVGISVVFSSYATGNGFEDPQDYIQAWYIVDGSPTTFFSENGAVDGSTGSSSKSFRSRTVTASGINGNTLQIEITLYNSANDEFYQFDNVFVGEGFSSGFPTFSNVNDPDATVSGLQPGLNTLEWTITSQYGVCPATSDQVNITRNLLVDPGTIGNPQTVCAGVDNPDPLTNVASAGGGDLTSYSYQWESSTTGAGGPFSEISGETGLTYDPPLLATTTWYRRKASSGTCPDTYSNVIEITVHQAVDPGTIGNAQTVCAGIDDPDALSNVASASGGDGSTYNYQWESSTAGAGGPFSAISGATGTTYNPGPIAVTTWYRRYVSSGVCNGAYSNVIELTAVDPPTANAGSDALICSDGSYTVNDATATEFTSLLWTHDGSGSLSNASTLTPTYTAATADGGNIVTLTLTASGNAPCGPAVSTMSIDVEAAAMANAGTDATICSDDTYTVGTASASNYTMLQWTHNGNGVINNGNTLSPTYIPASGDEGSTVTLTLTAFGNAPCGNESDDMLLTINEAAEVDAVAASGDICAGDDIDLTGSTIGGSTSSVTWSTSGSGTFNPNNTTLAATYTHSAADETAGSVTLTLTSNDPDGAGPCAPASDNVTVVINPGPPAVPTISGTSPVCQGETNVVYSVPADPTATHYSWSFDPALDVTVVGPSDQNSITVNFSTVSASGNITVTALNSCGDNGPSAPFAVTVIASASVSAGSDEETCEDVPFDLATSTTAPTASDYSGLQWTTSGTGTFSNANALTPTYTPAAGETGDITLTLTAYGNGPCPDVSDDMILHVTPRPVVNAGSDEETCQGVAFDLSTSTSVPSASEYSTLQWSSSGTGSFDDPGSLTPVYTPGAGETGNITLTLRANGNGSCAFAEDAMVLTITPAPAVNAGSDAETCEDVGIDLGSITTAPTASNYSSLQWSSSGSGTFSDPNILTPTYTPGAGETGNITLTLTASGNGSCAPVSDNLTLTVTPRPVVNAGSDEETCQGVAFDLSTSTTSPSASEYSTLQWSSSGTGSFDDPGSLTPVYTPGAGETGNITLTLRANGNGSCAFAEDAMVLTITPAPTANAGSDEETCEDMPFNLAGSATAPTASNYSSVQWSTSGTGTFSDPNVLLPVYTPGAGETGNITLTLTVNGNGSCAPVSDNMTLTVTPKPVVDAGSDEETCEGVAIDLSGATTPATASEYNSLLWTTSGTGSFSNNTVLNPVYTPGVGETGNITLTLTANGNGSCDPVQDQMTLTVTPKPVIDAGSNEETCEDVPFDLSLSSTQPTGSSYSSLLWTHNGTGSYNDDNILRPIYIPGAGETGNVTLTVTAYGNGSCDPVQDQMTLSITPAVVVDAGSNEETCEGVAFNLASSSTLPTASNYSSLQWSTSGSGTFSNPAALRPVYTPGAGETGNITLTLTAYGNGSCGSKQDVMTLTVTPAPKPNAGSDEETCEGTPFDMSTSSTPPTASEYNILNWTTSGTGTFDDASLLHPVYTPGAGETGSVTLTLTATGNGSCLPVTDAMTITVTPAPVVNAGSDEETCQGVPFDFTTSSTLPTASHYSTLEWTTTGTGVFDNDNILRPIYTPGAGETGTITMTLTAYGNGSCIAVQDAMNLTITPEVQVNAGSDEDGCQNTPFDLSTATVPATASEYSSLLWTTSGTGTFDDASLLHPVYTPGTGELGNVTLTLTASGNGSCMAKQDQMVLNLIEAPSTPPIGGGGGTELCVGAEGEFYSVPYTFGNTYVWDVDPATPIAMGGGLNDSYIVLNFPNPGNYTLSVQEYTPAPASCPGPLQELTIHVYEPPVADAGPDVTVCQGNSVILGGTPNGVGPSATGGSGVYSFTWSPSASLDDASAEHPEASPSATITYTLYVDDLMTTCPVASDDVTVTVQPLPIVDAGVNGETCEDIPFDLAGFGPSVSNHTSLEWTHNGTGTLDDPFDLTPVYTPGAGETGVVIFTLTATGIAPCGDVSDQVSLTVTPKPVVNAGSDGETCQGQSFSLTTLSTTPSASDYSSLQWSHNGAGSFDNNSILMPTYIPSAGETGTIQLTLRANGNGSCAFVEDVMNLTITPAPEVNAGSDGETCEDVAFDFNTLVTLPTASNYDHLEWTHNGSGSLDDPSILTPVYTPAAGETGLISFILTAYGNGSCTEVSDVMTLTINEKPVLSSTLNATVCSDTPIGVILSVEGGSVSAQDYDITDIRVDMGLTADPGNQTPGTNLPANAIASDMYTNTTTGSLTVEYDVIPNSADDCQGLEMTVVVTINPEPVGVDDTDAICSDETVGYDLQNNITGLGNGLTADFSWIATPNGNVSGESTTAQAGDVIDDLLTNTSGSDQVVVYTVTPTSGGGCAGDPFTVSVTVQSEPAGLNHTTSTCSNVALAYDLQWNVDNLGNGQAATFVWVAADNPDVDGESLTDQTGGTINDQLVNLSGAEQTVQYTVTPTGTNGCEGKSFVVTVTVKPEPEGVDDAVTICSDETSDYDLQNNINTLGNGQTANFSWVAASQPDVEGESTTPVTGNVINDVMTNTSGVDQDVEYTVTPTGLNGCVGEPFVITVTVQSEPVGVNDTESTCSDVPLAYDIQASNIDLLGNAQEAAFTWVAAAHPDVSGESTSQQSDGMISDNLTNLSGSDQVVVYTITPTGTNGCEGDPFTLSVTVSSEPVGADDAHETCSNVALAYDLQDNIDNLGNGQPAAFTWVAGAHPDVDGESTSVQSGSIINDLLVNTSAVDQVVEYTVTPTGTNTCAGDPFTVEVTVKSQPVGADATGETCSDIALAYDLQNVVNTLGNGQAADYTWVATSSAGVEGESLTPQSGDVIDDVLTNVSGADVDVIYTVTPTGENGCAGDDFTVTITVHSEPAGMNDTETTCSDVPLAYDIQSANIDLLGNGQPATFTWVAAANPNVGGESTTVQNGGTIDDNLTNTSGVDQQVVYTVTPTGTNGCAGDPFTLTVTVQSEPVGMDHVGQACSDVPLSYDLQNNISSFGNGQTATFTWVAADNPDVDGESLTDQSGGSINDILTNVSGIDQVVEYTVIPTGSNGCTGNPFTVSVTVYSEPLGVDDTGETCSGESVFYNLQNNILTLGNGQNATFSWVAAENTNVTGESTTPETTVVINDVITNLTDTDQDVVYTVTPTGSNGCVGDPFTVTITVKPEPVGVNDTETTCSDVSLTYDLQNNINTLGNGLASTFSWRAAENGNVTGESTTARTGNVINDVITNTSGVDQDVVYTVTPTGANGCTGDPFTVTVTVYSEPAGSNRSISTCSDVALAYDLQDNVTNDGNGQASTFEWVVAADHPDVDGETLVPVSSGVIDDVLTNESGADQVVTYTVTPTGTNGCVGEPFQITVTVRSEPVGVDDAAEVCSDGSLNYGLQNNVNTLGNAQSSAFIWVAAANPDVEGESTTPQSGGFINDNLTNLSGVDQELVYTVTPTGTNGCVGDDFTVTITVKPEPVGVNDTETTCSDIPLNYDLQNNIDNLGNGQAASFTWRATSHPDVSGESTSSQSGAFITDVLTNVSGTDQEVVYTVTPTGANGCAGDPFTITVTVNSEPRGANDNTSTCSNAALAYDLQNNIDNLGNGQAATFSWVAKEDYPDVDGESLVAVSSGTIDDVLVNTTGYNQVVTYVVTPTGTNGCAGDPFEVTVTVYSQPMGVDDAGEVCSDVAVSYNLQDNLTVLGNGQSATFSWVAAENTNVTGESTTPETTVVINDVITNLTGTDQDVVYTVTPTGSNGCVGDPFTVTITVKPEPVGVNDTETTCSDIPLNYDLQNNIDNLGNGQAASFTWRATSHPDVSGESTSSQSGAFITDVLTNVSGTDQEVVYTVTPTGTNGCAGDPFTITVTVYSEPQGANDNTSTCSNAALAYDLQDNIDNLGNGQAATFSWVAKEDYPDVDGESLVAVSSGTIDDVLVNTTGFNQVVTYVVTPTGTNGCAGDPFEVTVTVYSQPMGVDDAGEVCSDVAVSYNLQDNLTVLGNGQAATFSWVATANAGVEGETTTPVTGNVINDVITNTSGIDQDVVYTVTPTGTNGCVGDPFIITITVHSEPSAAAGTAQTCSDVPLNIDLQDHVDNNGNSQAATFTWRATSHSDVSGESTSSQSGAFITDVLTNVSGTDQEVVYTVTPTGTNGCAGDPFTITVTVYSEPRGANDNTSTCSNVALAYDLQDNIDNLGNGQTAAFTWVAADVPDVGGESTTVQSGSVIDDLLINTSGMDQVVEYTVTPTGANGCAGDPFTVTVTVKSQPAGGDDTDATCSDVAMAYDLQDNVNNLGNGQTASFTWVAAENGNVTGESLTSKSGGVINDVITNKSGIDQQVVYTVIPTGSNGCVGDPFTITVTVYSEPAGDNDTEATCSDIPLNYDLQNNVNNLGNAQAATYSWVAASNPNVAGESTTAQTGAFITDQLTNVSASDQVVVYTVTPTGANGCVGDPFTVSVTVSSEPRGANAEIETCSDDLLSYSLQNNVNTLGNGQQASFTWVAADNPDVDGESTAVQSVGTIDDNLNNISGVDQEVVYTVVPTGTNTCEGDPFTVTVTVYSEPVGLDDSPVICSNEAVNYELQDNINNLGNGQSSNFRWVAAANANVSGESTTPRTTGVISDILRNVTGTDQTVVYTVTPTGLNGCEGDPFTVSVVVKPEPVLASDLNRTTCSDAPGGILFDVTATSVSAASYNITDIEVDPSLIPAAGNVSPGTDMAADTALNDVFTNLSASPQLVVYHVQPVSADLCAGAVRQVSLTVYPEPFLDAALDRTVCSDEASGITLSVDPASVPATNYNIASITVDAGLAPHAGNASPANGLPSNVIVNDRFTNITTGELYVVYEIIPVSSQGCAGDTVEVTLTVLPEPVLSPGLDATVCSDEASGIILDVDAGSLPADSYRLANISKPSGLTAHAGNATTGSGKPATVLSADAFTNTTNAPLTVVYDVVPVSSDGCEGDVVQVNLTVNPEPVLDPNLSTSVCSGLPSGILLDVRSTSVAAHHYRIDQIDADPALTADAGNATAGDNQPFDAIAGDIFTNITSSPLNVVYDIVPVSDEGCEGEMEQVTLTVYPEPILDPSLDATVCSDAASGISLGVQAGSVAAAGYNIAQISVDPNLVPHAGNATTGNDRLSNAIAADRFTNTTDATLDVVYDIVPVSSNGCEGEMVQVTLTVNPEPVLDPGLDTDVCSGEASGIVLATLPTSVAADSYTIQSILVGFGLVPEAGNSGIGSGQSAAAISNDIFTNKTDQELTVTYTVVPVSANMCNGDPVQVVLTVHPEPVLASGLNRTVCSDEVAGIVLDVVTGSTPAAGYNILSINADPSLVPDPGNVAAGNGLPADAIMNDRFTNQSAIQAKVEYEVVPVSGNGCEGEMKVITLWVNPEPVLTPGLSDEVCSGEMIDLPLSVSNGVAGVSYSWSAPVNTGGMTGGTAQTAAIAINDVFENYTGATQTATYTVTPVTGLGCQGDPETVVITVHPNPVADITSVHGALDTVYICGGGSGLLLDGNPSGGSGNYMQHQWSGEVGPLSGYNTQTTQFYSIISDTYDLYYTVTDDNGCSGRDTVVVVNDYPKAIFGMDQNTGCTDLTVNFSNNSVGAVSYEWDFDDDGTVDDATPAPVHTFSNITTNIEYYNVKLVAISANGCRDSTYQVVTVYPTVAADFTLDPDTVCSGESVLFVAEAGGTQYEWDFGDGNVVTGGNVINHQYTNTGSSQVTRTVTLTTESFFLCTDQMSKDVVVYPQPTASFVPIPNTTSISNPTISFDNQTPGSGWSYLWDFGDGNTSGEFEPTHDYSAPGVYTVTLTVFNDACQDVATQTVTITQDPPVAGFDEVEGGCMPWTVHFNNTSVGADHYLWDFGDGGISNAENPEYTYYQAGTFTVRLTVTNSVGTDEYAQAITIFQKPYASFFVVPTFVYVNDEEVKCLNQSLYGDYYFWEFGDGETDTVYEPFHKYMEAGIYDIKLTVTTEDGCTDEMLLSPAVTVEPAGELRYSNAFRPNPNGPTGGDVRNLTPETYNQVFFPPIQEKVDEYHLQIFNRWGEMIFESYDINIGWDGYYRDKLAKQDVYIWKVTGKYSNGQPFAKAGDLTLLH